ncbi:integrin beta-1-like [Diretmus argenteus]
MTATLILKTQITSAKVKGSGAVESAWQPGHNNFTEVGQHIWERCDTARALQRRGCPSDCLEDPRGSAVLLKNHKITFHPKEQRHPQHQRQVTQLQPQTVLLHLRPGEPQTFEVRFKRVEDYPIDLYYLMDLSFSMEDDLPNVKKLGADLMEEMRNTTSDFRMGFGAFVDKTVMPYISTAEAMLQNPCKRTKPWPCSPPFTYHHVLSLTANGSLFTELVGGQRISGNLDSPEGGLDALMQAAVCEEQIGWRNVTRLLVFSTDAGFHCAGDGKLGGIVLPNDGKCHLQNNAYTKGNTQDYPSVAHVAEKLRQRNIQIIFAVTEDVAHLYEGLRSIFPKCAVGTLSNNSHNILQIIVEAYNALTSEVVMENSELPPGFHISYTSHCKDGQLRDGEQGRRCSNISIGDESSKKPKQANYGQYCECNDFNCDQYQGLQCGGIGFSGRACECPLSTESCLSRDGQVCAGRGVCHCGTCICQDHRFQGPTCDLCPSCPSVCSLHRAFSQGLSQRECEIRCAHLNLTRVGLDGVPAMVPPSTGLHRCMELDTEGCRVHFLLRSGQKEGSVHIIVAPKQECPAGPNVVLITAVVSSSVVVLGVAFLLLWKLLTSIHDRREFARFQRELDKRRWNKASVVLCCRKPIDPKWMMNIEKACYICIIHLCSWQESSCTLAVPQGLRERARVRNCVGMAVCVIEGVGPLGANGELQEFVMSAMLAMAY